MTKAKVVIGLHVALAAVAAGVLGVALAMAIDAISVQPPSPARLAAACSRFALPQLSVASAGVLAFGSLALAVVVLSVRSLVGQWRATRRFLAALHIHGRGPGGTLLFAGDAPDAFCAGLARPRVYVSDVALDALRDDELEAVLAHELHHQRLRDPLRVALARAVGDGMFFLPAARRLAQRYAALAELAADAVAVRAAGAAPLASALLVFERSDPAVVGIAPERVDHLLGDAPRWELPIALTAWSLLVLAAVAALVWRLSEAASHATVNLPLLAAQSCMLVMAVVPLMLGAGTVLGLRRLAGQRG